MQFHRRRRAFTARDRIDTFDNSIYYIIGTWFHDERPPQCFISVQSYGETSSADIKIQHKGGDRLVTGDWWISIVPAGAPPDYRRSSTDFTVGDQIITATLTSGEGSYIVTNSTISTDGPVGAMKPGAYDVKIIVYPFKVIVLDKVIEVR